MYKPAYLLEIFLGYLFVCTVSNVLLRTFLAKKSESPIFRDSVLMV
uniref:Uncharacterized protein n=1 Tax=Lepeophtheirus salmonis TaxID=72036 RepID=A0A0K2TE57_LEPSM